MSGGIGPVEAGLPKAVRHNDDGDPVEGAVVHIAAHPWASERIAVTKAYPNRWVDIDNDRINVPDT